MKRFPDGMLNVRTMDRNEVQLAIDWAAAEGWNPGIHDAECFYFADPHGFFLADYEGQPVGCVSAVRYDNTFAFVGLYLVKPEFRGQGIGSNCCVMTARCFRLPVPSFCGAGSVSPAARHWGLPVVKDYWGMVS